MTRAEILRKRRKGEISNAEALRMLRELHAQTMEENRKRLMEYQEKKKAALASGEVGLGFPTQEVPESVLERFRQRYRKSSESLLMEPVRQSQVMRNAMKRREERRARLLARHGRYGNRYA